MSAAVPAPVTAVAPVPAPTYFLRLQAIDFIARRDGGMGFRIGGKLSASDQRMRRQGYCLRAGRERRRSGCKSKGEFQKVPAFHDILLLCNRLMWEGEFQCSEMNVR
jgi:hypothetical protein